MSRFFIKRVFIVSLFITCAYSQEYLFVDFPKQSPSKVANTTFGKELKRLIEGSKHEIVFAIYGVREQDDILQVLIDAKNRGVKIRGVVDSDSHGNNYYSDTVKLYKYFEIKSDGKSHIMHNKFFVIDKKVVWSGSANISDTCSGGYNVNSVVVSHDTRVARVYLDEFEQMFYRGRFGKAKFTNSKTNIKTSSSTISIYFSPSSDTFNAGIKNLIVSAKKYIYIPIFYLTHKELSARLIEAKKRGVDIKIILDASAANNKYSTHKELRKYGIEVKVENFGGKMHAKSMIVDDAYVVGGSMNFTKAGVESNDENTLVIQNDKLAVQYRDYFLAIWNRIPQKYLKFDPRAEGADSIGSCFDGIDNDFDGKADIDDGCDGRKL